MPHSITLPDACQWLTQSLLSPLPAPPALDWLFDEGSLTRRLTRLSNDAFSVTPLLEGWQPLRDDECAALDLPPSSIGWVREVYLRGHGQAWVFARSVAARSALQDGGLNMDALGSRSLGELLFCDQAFTRQAIEVCQYPREWLPQAAQASALWARRSRFDRGPLSVLVAEIFLPSLWQAVHQHPENC
ncbi:MULTISPECIES: chorismate lyase [unclassified Pseudomonas]|uniref:chorismate--pyruvate lyase family protein n=1 Tax=unclassified Pseudomonas TaxID=196821 RepID=UPI0011F03FF8|nr:MULTISPECIES: chorismate lyase [unclassified Pseudomonas]KAA0950539.1 chorismate lyase [Pseudomonas sp. ANT_H4]KAA0952534.1 chorismate lyase [Pseudomonas sp. ANT_H14]